MDRSRGYGEYQPLRPGRSPRRHTPFLHTARLNIVGWAALVGACVGAAVVGVVVAGAFGAPGSAGAPAALVPLVAVVALDRRRWRGREVTFGWGAAPEEVATVVEALAARGVTARAEAEGGAGWGRRMPADPDAGPSASLVFRGRDARTVTEALRARGVRAPDLR